LSLYLTFHVVVIVCTASCILVEGGVGLQVAIQQAVKHLVWSWKYNHYSGPISSSRVTSNELNTPNISGLRNNFSSTEMKDPTEKNEPRSQDVMYYLERLHPLLLLDEQGADVSLLHHILLLQLVHQAGLVKELCVSTQHLADTSRDTASQGGAAHIHLRAKVMRTMQLDRYSIGFIRHINDHTHTTM